MYQNWRRSHHYAWIHSLDSVTSRKIDILVASLYKSHSPFRLKKVATYTPEKSGASISSKSSESRISSSGKGSPMQKLCKHTHAAITWEAFCGCKRRPYRQPQRFFKTPIACSTVERQERRAWLNCFWWRCRFGLSLYCVMQLEVRGYASSPIM